MDKREKSLIAQMANCLVELGVDLADERVVLRALHAADFLDGDIIVLFDRAVEEARKRKAAFAMPGDVA